MTRLQKYLNEKAEELSITSIEDIAGLIKSNCQPYLKDWRSIYKGNFFYSGRKESYNFAKGKVRKNRKPRHTRQGIHEFIDDGFYMEFGIRARSNSIFCIYDPEGAESYGIPYIIFPIGKYVTISGNIPDLFDVILRIKRSNFAKIENNQKIKDEYLAALKEELENANYQKNVLNIKSEVMITTKEYYILDIKYEEQIRKFLE